MMLAALYYLLCVLCFGAGTGRGGNQLVNRKSHYHLFCFFIAGLVQLFVLLYLKTQESMQYQRPLCANYSDAVLS